ncbi:MAG: signal peptidase II [Bacilli bacterium]
MKKKLYLLIIPFILIVDLLSKFFVNKYIVLDTSKVIIDNFFYLTYTHNFGAAFSMFNGKTIFILIVSICMFLYLVYELIKNINKYNISIPLSFIIGGLLGNLYDRLFLGYVRDFLDFHIFGFNAAIFNIGDTFIVIGVILLALSIIKEERANGKVKSN